MLQKPCQYSSSAAVTIGYKDIFILQLFVFTCQGREEALVMSQIEEEQRLEELRRAQAALLEKQAKNDKKKENEEFLDRLVMKMKTGFLYSS